MGDEKRSRSRRRNTGSWWFKRLYQQPWLPSPSSSPPPSSKNKKNSFSFRWKWKKNGLDFLDAVRFRVLYFLESVLLGAALCLFFLCCGCHL